MWTSSKLIKTEFLNNSQLMSSASVTNIYNYNKLTYLINDYCETNSRGLLT